MPTAASAVTVDQIVALARAGVTDAVILALIDRDKTIFSLEPDQLVTLTSKGVSEPVIVAMLKSGREEGERAAQAAADLNAAMILAERSPGPELLIIGHGPDVPNVAHPNGFYSGPPAGGYFPVPYIVDGWRRRGRYAAPVSPPHTASFTSPFQPVVPAIEPVVPPVALRWTEPPEPRALCRAEVNTATSTIPLTTIVECPAMMQPARRR